MWLEGGGVCLEGGGLCITTSIIAQASYCDKDIMQ